MFADLAPPRTDPVIEDAKRRLSAATPHDVNAATALLRDAAAKGVAGADDLLAALAAAGIGQPQSWPLAVEHLRRAAKAGSEVAQAQLDVLGEESAEPWTAWTAPPEKRTLNLAPKTVAIDRFIGPRACDWIIKRSAGLLKPSLVLTANGPEQVEARSCGYYAMSFLDCDVIVLLLRMRIAATIGVPPGALEEPQVLHYAVGQQFTRHYDYLDPSDPSIETAGQRLATFLVYLNDGYMDGETEFPTLNLRHKGHRGSALYFANLLGDGSPDTRSLHAGRAPRLGEKWVFSQWVRNRARI
jgi:prolyl 4-hydroxylase